MLPPPSLVLVATDFSAPAAKALAHAAWIAKAAGARLLLLHVVDPYVGLEWGDASAASIAPRIDELRETAEKRLREAAATVRASGVAVETHLEAGAPPLRILAVAHERKPDLVVLGTRGQTGLRRLLAGSVAHAVADRLEAPVLLVH